MLRIMARPELARHIYPSFSGETEARGRTDQRAADAQLLLGRAAARREPRRLDGRGAVRHVLDHMQVPEAEAQAEPRPELVRAGRTRHHHVDSWSCEAHVRAPVGSWIKVVCFIAGSHGDHAAGWRHFRERRRPEYFGCADHIRHKRRDERGDETREAIAISVNAIVDAVTDTIEETPPELVADMMARGITLAGGGSLLPGLADLLSRRTKMQVHLAEDPLGCVVRGTGKVLNELEVLRKVLVDQHSGRPLYRR